SPELRLRDRHDACDAEGDGGVDPRHRSREDGGSRTRFRQLDVRGAFVVLDRYRKAADRLLVPVASRLIHVNPNVVSWIAFLAAVGAGVSFFLGGAGFLSLALILLFGTSYLDPLDGRISRLVES